MNLEIFETLRQFNKRFPFGAYVCPNCKSITTNKYQCEFCNFQSNNITNQYFEYEIKELNLKEKILPPIETAKEKKNIK